MGFDGGLEWRVGREGGGHGGQVEVESEVMRIDVAVQSRAVLPEPAHPVADDAGIPAVRIT